MADVERKSDCTGGDEKISIPEDSPPVLNECRPSQFGISVQSFTPASSSSSSNRKDKSRLAQIKARRRSSIGVRGSTETDSLIRFMAQQRMKTPPTCQMPELVRNSPFRPRVASMLRQKMASFQNLMDVDEKEACDPMPKQDSKTGGCIKTRDYLSDEYSQDEEKENHPTLSKRRRLGPLEPCEVEIRETGALLHLSLKEQKEVEEPVSQLGTQRQLPSSDSVDNAKAGLISPHVDFELQSSSPPENQQEGVFELQTPSTPLLDESAAAPPAWPTSSLHICSLPSQLGMKPTGEDASSGQSAVKNKKKSVRFGGPLSPEFFDKNLPPSTPLQKGATPARAPTPGGSLKLRSVLKTPQRSESETPRAQPDISSPSVFGSSPVLKMPHNYRMQSVGEDSKEIDGKIVSPSVEEIDSEVTCDTECSLEAQPLNLNTAFNEESLSQILAELETKATTTSQINELSPEPVPETYHDTAVKAPAQSTNRRKKQPAAVYDSTSEAPARSSSRKRKQPEECEPVKRLTRSAAKSASGKIKTSTATRRWNKDVDRSLYGSRAYASKKSTLSPITEQLSFISPSPEQSPSVSCTASDHKTDQSPGMTEGSQTSEPTVTNAMENLSVDSITSSNSNEENTTMTDRMQPGPSVSARGRKRRKVSVGNDILLNEETPDQTGGKTDKYCKDQTAAPSNASRETRLTHVTPEQGGVNSKLNAQTSEDTHCTKSNVKLESHGSLDAPTSAEGSDSTARRRTRWGRRSSASGVVIQEQRNQAEEHQMSHEVEEKKQCGQQENAISSSDDQHEEVAASLDLAPWQADFNLEDVFKPITTRGQRSVRRSLRNKSSSEHSSSTGLAWLPRTSPDSRNAVPRKTRGHQLSAFLPVQPPLLEETQDRDFSNE